MPYKFRVQIQVLYTLGVCTVCVKHFRRYVITLYVFTWARFSHRRQTGRMSGAGPEFVRGGAKWNFADVVQRSRGGGKKLGLKIGGRGGEPLGPPPTRSALGCGRV